MTDLSLLRSLKRDIPSVIVIALLTPVLLELYLKYLKIVTKVIE